MAAKKQAKAQQQTEQPTEPTAEELAQQERVLTIAIAKVNPTATDLWTEEGTPKAAAIEAICGVTFAQDQIDLVYAAMLAQKTRLEAEEKAKAEEAEAAAAAVDPTPAPPPPNPVAAKVEEKMWWVIDTCASKGTRIHDIPGHGQVALTNKPTPQPREIAVKFLIDGFIVIGPDGKQINNLPDAENQRAGDMMPTKLADDEVIVKISELSNDALLIRVNRMPNGEAFHPESPREALIDFYMDSIRAMKLANQNSREDLDFESPMPDLDVQRVLEG